MGVGLVIAATAELSALALALEPAAYLLPAARFTACAWLVVAATKLPKARARRRGAAS